MYVRAGLVRAPARHGVVGVDDGHGPGEQRDLLTRETVGIPLAVVALVVVAHGEHQVLGEEGPDDVGAHHGVFAHLLPLLLVEAARLEEHAVRDADLADVVQVGGLFERREHVLGPAQLSPEHDGVRGHAGGVAQGVVVLGVEGGAQRLEVAQVHALDLVVELGVLDGEGELRAHALEEVAVDVGEGVRVGAAQVEDAEESGVGREGDDDAGRETLEGRRVRQLRQVVRQAHDEHPLRADALDEAGVEVVETDSEQRLTLGSRGDDPRHGLPLEQQQTVLVEAHQLAELVDGRLHDLFEVEAGGRPRGDVVEQLRLARRLLLTREQRGVVDGERGRVADRGRRVDLGLGERALGAALDELHGADHPVLDDQRQRGPALALVVLVDLVHGRREPRVAQRPDHRRPLGLDHLAGHRRVGQRKPLPHPLLVHFTVADAHQGVQLVALDHGDLALVDARRPRTAAARS